MATLIGMIECPVCRESALVVVPDGAGFVPRDMVSPAETEPFPHGLYFMLDSEHTMCMEDMFCARDVSGMLHDLENNIGDL